MSRVDALKERLLTTGPKLSCERLHFLEQAYKETEGQPMVMRRAIFLDRFLSGMGIQIDENPIVGTLTRYPIGSQPYPEYSCEWISQTAEYMGGQGTITEDEKKLLQDAEDYWRDKSISARTRQIFNEKYAGIAKYEDLCEAGILFEDVNLNASRLNVDFGKVLNKGLEGVIAEAQGELELLPFGSMDTYQRSTFLSAMIVACGAVIKLSRRYAALAREMAQRESDSKRRAELLKISEICEQVPGKPARTFHEAVQSVWFIHLATQIEHVSAGRGIGRFGMYTSSLYREDLANGRLTRDGAIELLEFLFIKLSELRRFMPGQHPQRAHGGGVVLQKMSLGGLNVNGDDATSEVDHLLLEAKNRVGLPEPIVDVLYHGKLSEEFLLKCAGLAATGIGMPSFFNNDIIVRRWVDHGATLEDARNCCVVGCVDTVCSHATGTLGTGDLNMPKILELALNNGRDPKTGKQLGPATGESTAFKSYSELRQAMARQMEYFTKLQSGFAAVNNLMKSEITPAVFCSALVDDCIKTGKEVTSAGARYSMDYGTVAGMIDVADSLAAVKKLVFDEKSVSIEDLMAALKANFKGYDGLRRKLVEAPKYGNDDDYVDEITRDLYNIFWDEHRKYLDHLGRKRRPRGITMTMRFSLGGYVGALPSGREGGTPLAEGSLCAETGLDVSGPSALIHSAIKVMDNVRYGGSMLNMRFPPSSLKDRKGLGRLLDFVKTYMDLGGYHVQFTVSDNDVLKEAQEHPEAHRDKLVAVTGFSGEWTKLSATVQSEIMRKTEFKLE